MLRFENPLDKIILENFDQTPVGFASQTLKKNKIKAWEPRNMRRISRT